MGLSEKNETLSRRGGVRRWSLRLLKAALLVYAGVLLVLFLVQRSILFPASRAITDLPSGPPFRLAYEDLSLRVGKETTNAWYLPAEPSRGVILFSHGNGGSLSDWIAFAGLFHGLAFDVMLYDYGGYGRSTGSPSEGRCEADARAAWDYLTKTRHVPPERIVLFGHSIGGGPTAHLASEVTPGAVVLESTFCSLAELCQEKLWWAPAYLLVRDRFNSLSKLSKIHAPLLVVHSPRDTLIPFCHGQRLFDAALPPKQLLRIRGNHNDGPFTTGRAYLDGLAAFLYPLFSDGWQKAPAPAV